jgi:hypothetical protein
MPHQADDSEAELTGDLPAALRERDRTRVLASSGALAAQTCRDLINVIMKAAGGSSHHLTSPRQRILSDVEMMKSLAFSDWGRCAQLEGRVALRLQNSRPLICFRRKNLERRPRHPYANQQRGVSRRSFSPLAGLRVHRSQV